MAARPVRDLRRRVAVASVSPVAGPDPTCQVPRTDPLVRAAKAVWSNIRRVDQGALDSTAETVDMVWQLVPVNDGWQQAWVDLGSGMAEVVSNPVAAARATVDVQTL